MLFDIKSNAIPMLIFNKEIFFKYMPAFIKKVVNVFQVIMVALIVILAILLVGVRLVGLKPYAVLSGSMEPTFKVGSMIYVRSIDPQALEVGDPITFYLNDTTVATHKIIEIIEDEKDPSARYFRTQGEANKDPDSEAVHSSRLIGKPVFTIPYLGYFSVYIQQPPGKNISLGICAFLLIITILSFIPSGKKE